MTWKDNTIIKYCVKKLSSKGQKITFLETPPVSKKVWKDYREFSKIYKWGREVEEGKNLTIEDLKIGCLLRIADSLERMEQPYKDLLQIIENYKEFERENKKLKQTISSLKGHIKKINCPKKKSL